MFALHESGDTSDTVHFPKLSQERDPDIKFSEEYMQILQNLIRQIESRFQNVETFFTAFKLFANAISRFQICFLQVPTGTFKFTK